MGGAVSSGRDNNELIDNLMGGNYIRSRDVEKVFRALDRADYMTPEARDQAYKDLAWRNGPLHMSAPCIYSEVMEGLELKPGLSFLNVGSGTGYLSTLVGLILGSSGISHGVEVHPQVVEYATKKLQQFLENSPTLDEFDFCEPKFYCGNGLCLAPLQTPYDRVYCGAGCPDEYQNYFQQLIKVGGVLVMPLNDNLLQVRRLSATEWSSRSLLNVSFAFLRVPSKEEARELVRLEEQAPCRLQHLTRAVIRASMRACMRRRHPQLREPPPRAPPAKKACPRRICIPVDDDSDEGLNALHDLDRASGANEMNALLSLVLSMGRNRAGGALRVDALEHTDDEDSSTDDVGDERDDDDDDDDDHRPDRDGVPVAAEGDSERQNGPEGSHTENTDRADSEGTDRPDVDEGSERQNTEDRPARPEAGDQPRHSDRGDRPGRPASGERSDRADRCSRSHRLRSVIMFEFRDTLNRRSGDENTGKETTENNEQAAEPSPAEPSSPNDSQSTSKDSTPPRNRTSKFKRLNRRLKGSKDKKPSSRESRRRARDRRHSDEKKDEEQPNPEVPAEVEIYLGKSREEPGTSTMEWEPVEQSRTEEIPDSKVNSSEDETETSSSKVKEEKRQKLDSGIGDDRTPSAGSHTSHDSDSGNSTHSRDSDTSDTATSHHHDEGCEDVKGRRRRQKRGHLSTRSSSSTDGEFDISYPEGSNVPIRRPRRRGHSADNRRRVALSLHMKRAVKELPLPHALKKYVNLGRCFEF